MDGVESGVTAGLGTAAAVAGLVLQGYGLKPRTDRSTEEIGGTVLATAGSVAAGVGFGNLVGGTKGLVAGLTAPGIGWMFTGAYNAAFGAMLKGDIDPSKQKDDLRRANTHLVAGSIIGGLGVASFATAMIIQGLTYNSGSSTATTGPKIAEGAASVFRHVQPLALPQGGGVAVTGTF